MAFMVEKDKPVNPIDVRFFGTNGIPLEAYSLPDPIQKFDRWRAHHFVLAFGVTLQYQLIQSFIAAPEAYKSNQIHLQPAFKSLLTRYGERSSSAIPGASHPGISFYIFLYILFTLLATVFSLV